MIKVEKICDFDKVNFGSIQSALVWMAIFNQILKLCKRNLLRKLIIKHPYEIRNPCKQILTNMAMMRNFYVIYDKRNA